MSPTSYQLLYPAIFTFLVRELLYIKYSQIATPKFKNILKIFNTLILMINPIQKEPKYLTNKTHPPNRKRLQHCNLTLFFFAHTIKPETMKGGCTREEPICCDQMGISCFAQCPSLCFKRDVLQERCYGRPIRFSAGSFWMHPSQLFLLQKALSPWYSARLHCGIHSAFRRFVRLLISTKHQQRP